MGFCKNNLWGDIMVCEYRYCIYNKENECLLESIDIDSLGMCESCIIVSLDDDFLEKAKENELRKIASYWGE